MAHIIKLFSQLVQFGASLIRIIDVVSFLFTLYELLFKKSRDEKVLSNFSHHDLFLLLVDFLSNNKHLLLGRDQPSSHNKL